MDVNDLCITLVLVNCVWLLTMRPARAWGIKASFMLTLLGGAWWWVPDRAGLIAIGPWAILIMLPLWLQHWTMRLVQQRRLGLARWMAIAFTVLHPTSAVRSLRYMIRILTHLYQGDVATGLQLARQVGISDPGIRSLGLVLQAQMSGHWLEFEYEMELLPDRGLSDPSLLAGKVQALAERGAWEELNRVCGLIGQAVFSAEHNAALNLRTFAVLGDVSTVRNVILGSSQLLAWETREFWLAVAEQVSGAEARASQRLTKLLPRSSAAFRPMIERRLAVPTVGPVDDAVRERGLHELSTVRTVIEHDARYAVLSGGIRGWPVMTLSLMLVILAIYLKEIPGGSENTRNLEELGAMIVPLTGEPGEWKRVFTSGFLHFGPVHLLLNLLGLLYLGRLVERAWGSWRMLVLFMICIVTSASLLPWLTFLEPGDSAVFAGASGGIMGLLGGLWGHLLIGRYRRGTPLVQKQFRSACTFIVIQSVCDVMTPQVSMTCHLIGLAMGMVCGVLMGLCGGRR